MKKYFKWLKIRKYSIGLNYINKKKFISNLFLKENVFENLRKQEKLEHLNWDHLWGNQTMWT